MEETLDTVLVEMDEETGLGHITLNRPDKLNTINQQLKSDLTTALKSLREHDKEASGVSVRAVVLEGAGERAFCAGADVSGFGDRTPGQFEQRTIFDRLADFPAPVIAKIEGYCLGGGLELALACDLRLASAESEFGLPEVELGLLPGGGGVQYISRLAGPAVAMEIAMTGKRYSTEFAEETGIVSASYPNSEFDEAVDEFVHELARKPPLALRAIKDAAHRSVETGLAEGRRYDRRVFSTLLETADHEAAAAAFKSDDQPEFEGR
ncbi:enoyl-CoA hydratase/isomerase family protein [Halosolutus amylolyticus]|uniref:Enoyl-CoA hydratase/isomerase family protein n=1 Tax=Halosolutus amylolyticus TaxID=2932267 RepID=A0ABD5PIL6_9EURY|nr:enoyl-CoA hydratase/isomerase family protein [Halosolutus amylolyticus]